MVDWHGIVVDESLNDKNILSGLKIIGNKKSSNSKWILYNVAVDDKNLEKTIKKLQKNLKDKYYFHFYKSERIIVTFKNKIFNITTDKRTWKKAVLYGISLGIPKEQMDIKPCRIEDETY